jgi:hypothetical protein
MKKECLECGGEGFVVVGKCDAWGCDAFEETCTKCEGTGELDTKPEKLNITNPITSMRDTVRISQQRTFQLHDSETICKLFLQLCKSYESRILSTPEFVRRAMKLKEEAENFGIETEQLFKNHGGVSNV